MNIELGNYIKEAREEKGISQRELAKRINVDNALISKIEKGKVNKPNYLTLVKLCKELDLDLIDLLNLAKYEILDFEILSNIETYDNFEEAYSLKENYMNKNKEIDANKVIKDYKNGKLNEIEALGIIIEAMELDYKARNIALAYLSNQINKK